MIGRRQFLASAAAAGVTVGWRTSPRAQGAPRAVVDAHCHVFNVLDLPVAGFIEAYFTGTFHLPLLGFMRELIDKFEAALIAAAHARAAERPAALQAAQDALKELKAAAPADLTWAVELTSAIEIATKPRVDVAAQVADLYRDVDLFLPCLVDFDGWTPVGSRPPENSLDKRIEEHEAVALKFMSGKARARFHPFVSFNPRRADSLDSVKSAVETRGFVGVKLYPPCGFSASGNEGLRALPDGADIDRRLEELFAYCEASAVPILAHTSASNAFRRGAEYRASPLTWETTLENHPKLRLNLGHFGHDHGVVDGCPNVECLVWSLEIASLMQRYDHVYADIGDSPLGYDPKFEASYVTLLNQLMTKYDRAAKRILYGSDWWMNELEQNPAGYYKTIQASLQKNLPRLVPDVMGDSALRFLGFRKDDGTVNNCNANWQRLFKYYAAKRCTPPAWLAGDGDKLPVVCLPGSG